MALELTQQMMRTLALAIQHQRMTRTTIVLNFHSGNENSGALVLTNPRCLWHKGVWTGKRDISINMTADEVTLKQMTATLFDD